MIRALSQGNRYDTLRALDALEKDPRPDGYRNHGANRYVLKAAKDSVEILYEVRISGDVVLVDISETWRSGLRAALRFYPDSSD